jgi:hypothetical protein
MKRNLFLIIIMAMLMGVYGCSSSTSEDDSDFANSSGGNPEDVQSQKLSPEEFFALQGLKLIKSVSINGDTGWLCEFPGRFTECTGLDGTARGPVSKKCMILSGKPYSLGYQSAMLMPDEGYAMCTTFMKRVALGQLWNFGITLPTQGEQSDKLYKLIYDSAALLGQASLPDIPKQSIAGYEDVTFDDLLVMNQAVDATYYLLGAALGYSPKTDVNKDIIKQLRLNLIKLLVLAGQKETDPETFFNKNGLKFPVWGCNELAVTASATATGETYHGRDFMFSTADTYQDCAVMAVYLPDTGYPFATVTVPGFIGQSTAINSEGLSAGQDICMVGVAGITPGVGSMLVIRDIAQNSANLDEAVSRMRAIPRGMPWIYFIVDDERDSRWGNAVELETITNQYQIKGPEKLKLWEQALMLPYILKLDDEQLVDGYIDRGVMVRGMTWQYPEKFTGIGNDALDHTNLQAYKDYYGEGMHFPMQHETDSDFVAAANHFIIPRLTMLHYDPVVYLGYFLTGQLPESVWRYENMENNFAENKGKITYFGDGDYPETGSTGWHIDFLNTKRDYPWFYRGKDLSKPENTAVDGHHAAINNDKRIITGLFGYMTDPWVKVELMDFVNWYNME